MPLFKGAPDLSILEEMKDNEPWPVLMSKMKEKKSKLQYLEPTSIICRILDANREVLQIKQIFNILSYYSIFYNFNFQHFILRIGYFF